MKYSVKFPYDVVKHPINIIHSHTDEFYEYDLSLPDVVFSEAGLLRIDKDDLQLVTEVNCTSTMYRECFYSSDSELNKINFRVPKGKVNHIFHLDILIIAKRSLEFNNQVLEKGMPLAHLGSNKISLSRRQKGLIVFDKTEEQDISYEFGSDVIKVKIPEKEYNDLSTMKMRPEIKHLLASQFAQIALLEACKFLKEGDGKSHLNWHIELQNRWKKTNSEKEFPEEEDYLNLVNKILKQPSLNFSRFLIMQAKTNKDE